MEQSIQKYLNTQLYLDFDVKITEFQKSKRNSGVVRPNFPDLKFAVVFFCS